MQSISHMSMSNVANNKTYAVLYVISSALHFLDIYTFIAKNFPRMINIMDIGQ